MVKKPKTPTGVDARCISEKPRVWRFRARAKLHGHTHTGSWRDDVESAAQDYEDLRKRLDERHHYRARSDKLAGALEAEIDRQKARRDPDDVEREMRGIVNWLLDTLRPEMPLRVLEDPRSAQRLVDFALADGRSPDTVKRYWRLVARVMKHARLEAPSVDIPKHRRKVPPFFSPEELVDVLDRMRTSDMPNAERDHALAQLIARTGIRAEEACRIRVEHVMLDRKLISIESKDKSNPRTMPITDALRPYVVVLLEHAVDGKIVSSIDAWRSMWRRWSKRLGVTINGRKLRTSLGTRALYAGAALGDVRDLLGHKHASTTDKYAQIIGATKHVAASLADELLRKAHGEASRRDSTKPDPSSPGKPESLRCAE